MAIGQREGEREGKEEKDRKRGRNMFYVFCWGWWHKSIMNPSTRRLWWED